MIRCNDRPKGDNIPEIIAGVEIRPRHTCPLMIGRVMLHLDRPGSILAAQSHSLVLKRNRQIRR